jgi:hypothetical protein
MKSYSKNQKIRFSAMVIEKDGHSIFSEIPWGNTGEKEEIIKYLTSNAKNTSFESAGIGEWD